jgi:hypothetical protein
LAGRDSFQKRQKEAARREKRQVKLERRQGRQQPSGSDSETDENGIAYPVDLSQLPLTTAPGRPSADPLANLPLPASAPNPDPPIERRIGVLKPVSVEPEPPKTDTPRRER